MNCAELGGDVLRQVGRMRGTKGLLPWVLCAFAFLVLTPKARAQGWVVARGTTPVIGAAFMR
jgi:hypothetical protein